MKDIIKILLGAIIGVLVWQMLTTNGFALPEIRQPQRMTQPDQIVYPTTEPARVEIISPTWAPPTAVPTATAVPQLTSDNDATPEPQRSEQGNERGCASTRSCN